MKRSDYIHLISSVPSGKFPEGKKYKRNSGSAHKSNAFPRTAVALVLSFGILLTGLVSGCSNSGQQTSSAASSSDSQAVSEPVPSSIGKTPGSSLPSSSAVPQSESDYALPAAQSTPSSSASQPAAAQSAVPAASAVRAVSQASGSTVSQSVFQSVFGDQTQSGLDTQKQDDSGPDISLAEYDKIQDGMTYAAVKAIIGSEGKIDWKSGVKGSDMYTEAYRWNGNGSSGSYALLTFEGGKLDMKIQFGLE